MSNGQTGAMVQDNTWTYIGITFIVLTVLAIGVIVSLFFFIGTRKDSGPKVVAPVIPAGSPYIATLDTRYVQTPQGTLIQRFDPRTGIVYPNA